MSPKNKIYELFSSLPCFICGRLNTDANHVVNRSQGGSSSFSNFNSLCRPHHEEWTRRGAEFMFFKYAELRHSQQFLYQLQSFLVKLGEKEGGL